MLTKRDELYTQNFKSLTDWMKNVYGDKVEKITVSNRAVDTPCLWQHRSTVTRPIWNVSCKVKHSQIISAHRI